MTVVLKVRADGAARTKSTTIAAVNAAPLHENQGKPWTHEEDTWLRQAFQTGSDIKEMSVALKRPRAEIRARMDKLGLRWDEV